MNLEDFITLDRLCSQYHIERSFFSQLDEYGLIEIHEVEQVWCIHQDSLSDVEKIIRMSLDLEINMEGIETILHLQKRINELQNLLNTTQNKLKLYESTDGADVITIEF